MYIYTGNLAVSSGLAAGNGGYVVALDTTSLVLLPLSKQSSSSADVPGSSLSVLRVNVHMMLWERERVLWIGAFTTQTQNNDGLNKTQNQKSDSVKGKDSRRACCLLSLLPRDGLTCPLCEFQCVLCVYGFIVCMDLLQIFCA
jgi:hypothetical protein